MDSQAGIDFQESKKNSTEIIAERDHAKFLSKITSLNISKLEIKLKRKLFIVTQNRFLKY